MWAALRALHTGEIASTDGDEFRIDGPFAVGTELDVTPQGQDTFRSRIVELVENERYADRTEFGDVSLTFRHTLEPTAAGTRVTHQLVIDGPGADTHRPGARAADHGRLPGRARRSRRQRAANSRRGDPFRRRSG